MAFVPYPHEVTAGKLAEDILESRTLESTVDDDKAEEIECAGVAKGAELGEACFPYLPTAVATDGCNVEMPQCCNPLVRQVLVRDRDSQNEFTCSRVNADGAKNGGYCFSRASGMREDAAERVGAPRVQSGDLVRLH